MKKLFLTLILISSSSSVFAVAAESAGGEEASAAAARSTAVTSSIVAVQQEQEIEEQQRQLNNTVANSQVNHVTKGILICHSRDIAPNGYQLYSECKDPSLKEWMSIQDFYNSYKPDDAKGINMVIKNEDDFDIYYY